MIPEILHISIPSWIKIPSDYAGFKQEITQSNIQREQLEIYLKNNLNKSASSLLEDDAQNSEVQIVPNLIRIESNLEN